MQYFFFFLSLVITIIYCEIRAKKRAGKEKLGLELKPSSTFHLKDYRSQGHENNLKPHWEKGTKKRSCKKIKLVNCINQNGRYTLLEAFLYLVTAWVMRSLTRMSPFPQGTTTLTGPKQTVTFIVE